MAKKNSKLETTTLASRWSPPAQVPGSDRGAGAPIACIATTYTFDARLFEEDMLPRFLGLKFDNTEKERPFVVEREQALGTTRACVLLDQSHVDSGQSTLRWDQLPVHVPGGVQHAKVTLLAWERLVRLIVASANLTRRGYRKNRELACVLDFYDNESSTPRQVLWDAIDFLAAVTNGVRAVEAAVLRLRGTLEAVRVRVRQWRNIAAEFTPLERPCVYFVSGLPRGFAGAAKSPLDQMLQIWGDRRAHEVKVLTPFVGEVTAEVNPVIENLRAVARRETKGVLAVPGQPSERNERTMVVNLSRRFRDAWAAAWQVQPDQVETYVVPPCRSKAKETHVRDLHAKAVFLTDYERELLLCGSSNFSPHGMGVGVYNIEANLCYLDKYGERLLDHRLPVDWDNDRCINPTWLEEPPITDEDAPPAAPALPAVFHWASYNQKEAKLTIRLDPAKILPAAWSIYLPGERANELPSLVDHLGYPNIPEQGRIEVQLPEQMRTANITCLRVAWTTDSGESANALMPVQVENADHLLPPAEFRAMTVDTIVTCLIAGRDPAEWVDAQEHLRHGRTRSTDAAIESLRAVDTSGYALYRVRRFGQALATLGERLVKTVRTREAISYRLTQDPLGPRTLATALVSEWQDKANILDQVPIDRSHLVFCLSELALTVAHAGRKLHAQRQAGEPDIRPGFRDTVSYLMNCTEQIRSVDGLGEKLTHYIRDVNAKCEQLVGAVPSEGDNAA